MRFPDPTCCRLCGVGGGGTAGSAGRSSVNGGDSGRLNVHWETKEENPTALKDLPPVRAPCSCQNQQGLKPWNRHWNNKTRASMRHSFACGTKVDGASRLFEPHNFLFAQWGIGTRSRSSSKTSLLSSVVKHVYLSSYYVASVRHTVSYFSHGITWRPH